MKRILYVVVLAVMPWFSLSCEKESFVEDDGSVRLTFSCDTLTFDTVFTTMGSTTLRLTVTNGSSDNVMLSSVTLEGGRASRFRLNVDGDTSLVARDVELLAHDSLFIFVQVNINPNDSTTPFLVSDAILFSNGQRLPLTAYGRNARYHIAPDGGVLHLSSQTWDATLPHIVVGNMWVDSLQTLTISPGAEVHFANDACLVLESTARLQARGSEEEPIVFTSLRHDGWYRFLPGQWGLIWFRNNSIGNVIDHAVVENGIGGLRLYPGAQLTLTNSIVRNMSDCGLVGQQATLNARNLLVYDCLTSFIALLGGNYEFRHSTFAGYWNYTSRELPTVVLTNYMALSDSVEGGDLERADFIDCIVWGSYNSGEVLLSFVDGYSSNHRFLNSIVRGGERDEDPLFSDPANDDYTLQEGSPAAGLGYEF